MTEAETRIAMLDLQLAQAGWLVSDPTMVGEEFPLPPEKSKVQETPTSGVPRGTGFTDYCLYAPGGEILSVIEAKSSSRGPRDG